MCQSPDYVKKVKNVRMLVNVKKGKRGQPEHNSFPHYHTQDRWDRTPLDDAESFDYPKCATIITECCKKKGINLPLSYKAYIELTNKPNGPLPSVTSS